PVSWPQVAGRKLTGTWPIVRSPDEKPTAPRTARAGPAADDRLVEPADGLPRALPRALRQALHGAPDRAEPVRRALGSRRAQAALSGAARGPAPPPGSPDPRARGRRQLGDPAGRVTPPATAKAPAAGLSRREHAAPCLADGGAGR